MFMKLEGWKGHIVIHDRRISPRTVFSSTKKAIFDYLFVCIQILLKDKFECVSQDPTWKSLERSVTKPMILPVDATDSTLNPSTVVKVVETHGTRPALLFRKAVSPWPLPSEWICGRQDSHVSFARISQRRVVYVVFRLASLHAFYLILF